MVFWVRWRKVPQDWAWGSEAQPRSSRGLLLMFYQTCSGLYPGHDLGTSTVRRFTLGIGAAGFGLLLVAMCAGCCDEDASHTRVQPTKSDSTESGMGPCDPRDLKRLSALLAHFSEATPAKRGEIMTMFQRARPECAGAVLVEGMESTSVSVRALAAALALQQPEPIYELRLALEGLLADPAVEVRLESVRALLVRFPEVDPEPAFEVLTQALELGDPSARRAAAVAIEELGLKLPRFLPALLSLLASDDETASRVGARALRAYGADGVPAIGVLLELLSSNTRPVLVVGILESMGCAAGRATPQLRELLRSESRDLQLAALKALPLIAKPSRELLQDLVQVEERGSSAEVRLAAAAAQQVLMMKSARDEPCNR